nr:radical SAM protein [Desulfobacula sp.]
MKTDPPHILCVNPWIHDFAAFDFWAKPLGLLSLAAILRENGVKMSYIDCLDRFHPRESRPLKILRDGRGPFRKTPIPLPAGLEHMNRKFSRYGILPEWFLADLARISTPDLIFVTSLMTYWASGVKETIDLIKTVYPDVPLVLGGIYAGLCHDHAVRTSGADLVVKGPGEPLLAGILKEFTGFGLEDERLLKSPIDLDSLPFPALDLQRAIPYAPVLTSRGCPFSCEYCASSYLEPVLRRRSPEGVYDELTHWHETQGVKNFAFYDDALLVNAEAHAFPLLERIIASGLDLHFHTPNALHIRAVTKKAAELMFRAGFKTIRLGLETTEFSKKRSYDAKVTEEEFVLAARHLKAAGFKEQQIGAYLLCGLPGQNLDVLESSIGFVKKAGILPVLAYYTPIPHTALWAEAIQNSRYDLLQHPVFTNNTLFPCVGSDLDLKRISQLKNL